MSEQKERSARFYGHEVRATIDGRMTQFRRVVKPQPDFICTDGTPARFTDLDRVRQRLGVMIECPYGVPGDRLWVRETWQGPLLDDDQTKQFHENGPEAFKKAAFCAYRATETLDAIDADGAPLGWKPSIHMPRWASRITLELTRVRVERLQDISEEDAIAEGVERTVTGDGWRRYAAEAEELAGIPPCVSAARSFQSLWLHINGLGSWDANPYVWVVAFKRQELGA